MKPEKKLLFKRFISKYQQSEIFHSVRHSVILIKVTLICLLSIYIEQSGRWWKNEHKNIKCDKISLVFRFSITVYIISIISFPLQTPACFFFSLGGDNSVVDNFLSKCGFLQWFEILCRENRISHFFQLNASQHVTRADIVGSAEMAAHKKGPWEFSTCF